jgi:DNA-binding XRE family transcriptional regulator
MSTPLKLARLKIGVTADGLARAVGVNQSTIARIENGKKRPSPELANRIALHFGNAITRDQILFPEDYMEKTKKPVRSARLRKVAQA